MSSKLRPLYDKLYIRVETMLLAFDAARSFRKNARRTPTDPKLDAEYKTNIRAYWKQFRTSVPAKYWFCLPCGDANGYPPQYIPEDKWFDAIVPHYNNLIFAKALQDKCLHNVLFPGIKRPETVVKRIAGVFYDDALTLLSREEAMARCRHVGRILIKPSVGSGQGNGIRFFSSDELSEADISALFDEYGQNFIVQKKMSQHAVLAAFNPNSLNTIRVMTFLYKDKVHVLNAVLRVGGGTNEVDNVSQGGYQCTILPDGRLDQYAITKLSGRWNNVSETASGIRFSEVIIPSYDRIRDTVCTAAMKMSHFKILGWDIAVDPDGEPVLVEYNVIPAQNQGTCGPTFGPLTDEVLTEVFGRRASESSSLTHQTV